MARTVIVPLSEPRLDHDESRVTEIVLREPQAHEYWAIGEIFTQVQRPDGSVVVIENVEAIRSYLDALVVAPKSRAIVQSLGFRDAVALKEAVIRFFVDARQALSGSSANASSSTGSSSTPRAAEISPSPLSTGGSSA